YLGNSSDRKRKSKERQLDPSGTARSTLRIVTSSSVSPLTWSPPRPVLAKAPGWSTSETLPLLRIEKVPPSRGKPARVLSPTPVGAPSGGVATNEAPVTSAESVARA